jgi:hypothetical protein
VALRNASPPSCCAAGLVPSAGEEEASLRDPQADAYAPADAAAAASGCAAGLGGPAALAGMLTAPADGMAASGPLRQVQLLRAVWSWVARHCAPPPGVRDTARCAAEVTCEVGWPLFAGPDAAALEAVSACWAQTKEDMLFDPQLRELALFVHACSRLCL